MIFRPPLKSILYTKPKNIFMWSRIIIWCTYWSCSVHACHVHVTHLDLIFMIHVCDPYWPHFHDMPRLTSCSWYVTHIDLSFICDPHLPHFHDMWPTLPWPHFHDMWPSLTSFSWYVTHIDLIVMIMFPQYLIKLVYTLVKEYIHASQTRHIQIWHHLTVHWICKWLNWNFKFLLLGDILNIYLPKASHTCIWQLFAFKPSHSISICHVTFTDSLQGDVVAVIVW